tara:strand:- start:724 stop:1005 length:282 start_codon:yes stop_codon:yes gene_type:complete
MATKEKIVDLKAKPSKVSDEHLKSLQEVVNRNNALQFRIGGLEAQKYELVIEKVRVQHEILSMQELMGKEYGTFDIDLKDGSINYPEDGESRD